MTTKLFEKVKKRSIKWGESNDCTVKALAIATDIPYEQAHGLLALRGRCYRKGTSMSNIFDAMKSIGWTATTIVDKPMVERHERWTGIGGMKMANYYMKESDTRLIQKMQKQKLFNAKTIKTLADYIPSRGIFLVETASHVLCVRAGKIHDWTKNRRHRITQIHRISRIKQETTE